jgi:hypothetical protein
MAEITSTLVATAIKGALIALGNTNFLTNAQVSALANAMPTATYDPANKAAQVLTISDVSNDETLNNADPAKVVTEFAVKTYADALAAALESQIEAAAGGLSWQGAWDASGGSFPGSGSASNGFLWRVSVAGTVDSIEFAVGDTIVALTDDAATDTYADNWQKFDNTDAVSSVAGLVGAISAANLRTALNVEDNAAADQTGEEIADLIDTFLGSDDWRTGSAGLNVPSLTEATPEEDDFIPFYSVTNTALRKLRVAKDFIVSLFDNTLSLRPSFTATTFGMMMIEPGNVLPALRARMVQWPTILAWFREFIDPPSVASASTAIELGASHDRVVTRLTAGTAITITAPTSGDFSPAAGYKAHFAWMGAGQPTLVSDTGAVINGLSSFSADFLHVGGIVTIEPAETDAWIAYGALDTQSGSAPSPTGAMIMYFGPGGTDEGQDKVNNTLYTITATWGSGMTVESDITFGGFPSIYNDGTANAYLTFGGADVDDLRPGTETDWAFRIEVRPEASVQWGDRIYGCYEGGSKEFLIGIDASSARVRVYLSYNGTTDSLQLVSTTTLAINTNYDIYVERDGTTVNLYINGVIEDSETIGANNVHVGAGTYRLGYTTTAAFRSHQGRFAFWRGSSPAGGSGFTPAALLWTNTGA